MQQEPKVNLLFSLSGQTIPVDHGYLLYSAISRIIPEIHNDTSVGICLIRGSYIGAGLLDISQKGLLKLRLPVTHVRHYIPLAGKELLINNHRVLIGVPHISALSFSSFLYAHMVTTKNGLDAQRFSTELYRQMDQLQIKGTFHIGKRKTCQIHNRQIVGYSLLVSNLSNDHSIILKENGLGGRRKMGCGFFEPRATYDDI